MSKSSFNSKIIKGINENCEDEKICGFLKKLLAFEAEQPGTWRWKENYKNILEIYFLQEEQSE